MNDLARRMVMDRQRRRRDYEMGDRRRDYGYDERRGDRRLSDPIGTEPEYPQEMWDGKQGVKGTGPYGIGGRLYSRSHSDYDDEDYTMTRRTRDYGEYEMDGHHPSGLMRLKKKDYMEWESMLENADGSHGKHFDSQQIRKIAESLGIRFDKYTEKELAMTTNMLYSDFCEVLKPIIPPEKEVLAYVKLAQAWLEDSDASARGSEKLALYYWCIVSDED
jgi:hypothetical protein